MSVKLTHYTPLRRITNLQARANLRRSAGRAIEASKIAGHATVSMARYYMVSQTS